MRTATGAALFALAIACAAVARADPPTAGLTLNASIGTHRESNGETRVPLLPLPLLNVRVPVSRFELELEGLPPLTFAYDSGVFLVTKSTRISYLASTLRYRSANGWTFGYGGILYNQETIYRQMGAAPLPCLGCPPAAPPLLTQFERSRVGGARYELGYEVSFSERRSLSVMLGVAPNMHAPVREDFSYRPSFTEPESASQVDGQVRFAVKARSMTWIYGVRYINYVARFDSNGSLADHNTLTMPFIGGFFPLGR